MPTLHFSGRFVFQVPEYNNRATNDAEKEKINESNITEDQIYQICGCDPEHYFEFVFRDVQVNLITSDNGLQDNSKDLIIGQRVFLNSLLVDVSPSAICGQLFAGSLKVGNLLTGSLQKASQSELRANIKPLNFSSDPFSDVTAGAYFDSLLDIVDKESSEKSAFLSAIDNKTQLEFHMHVNRFTGWNSDEGNDNERLNGDVYGYIRDIGPISKLNGLRLKSRRLISHPELDNTSKIGTVFIGSIPTVPHIDIYASYDILHNNLIFLRILEMVPFLDRCHNTPTDRRLVSKYVVSFITKNKKTKIGEFQGTYEELKKNGGAQIFQIPENKKFEDDFSLIIEVEDADNQLHLLMIESDLDLILEADRGITLYSGSKQEVSSIVYFKNLPLKGYKVRLLNQQINTRSPCVAVFSEAELSTDERGRVHATIQSINLEDSEVIFDPVTKGYLNGNLPWDRYYGNYVYMEIDNLAKHIDPPVTKIEIPVRVLHKVNVESLGVVSFKQHIVPFLFRYYIRYFPWLHSGVSVDLADYETSKSFVRNGILLDRLKKDYDDWQKMPRSRDFPLNGIELIKMWKEQDYHK